MNLPDLFHDNPDAELRSWGEYPPRVRVAESPSQLGVLAATHAARVIQDRLASVSRIRVMLAAAPSQMATLTHLSAQVVDWSRVDLFHMDDYCGLDAEAPQAFGNWLESNFVTRVSAVTFTRIALSDNPENDARRYAVELGDAPFDLVLLGLGVNGHLAFNDPPADLDTTDPVRVVELDSACRQQQVDEGHFPSVDRVPTHAITVTIPRLLNTAVVIGSIPGAAKREAVLNTLCKPVGPSYPSTALRWHPDVTLYLDTASAGC